MARKLTITIADGVYERLQERHIGEQEILGWLKDLASRPVLDGSQIEAA